MSAPSASLFATGIVGAYLQGSSWLLILIATVGLLVSDGRGVAAVALFSFIAVLLQLGGAICQTIGWIGVNRLRRGSAFVVACMYSAIPATFILIVPLTLGMPKSLAPVNLLFIELLALHAFALAWFASTSASNRNGRFLGIVAHGGTLVVVVLIYILTLKGISDTAVTIGLLMVFLVGETLTNAANLQAFRLCRHTAMALSAF